VEIHGDESRGEQFGLSPAFLFCFLILTNLLYLKRMVFLLVMKTGFGWIEIGENRYEYDIIIHTDGTISKRPKKRSRTLKPEYGHTPLSEEELDVVRTEHPEVVYIGTGQSGSLPVTPEAHELLRTYETVMLPTPQLLSRLSQEKRRHVAIVHVTC
jgi:hypothetical protein